MVVSQGKILTVPSVDDCDLHFKDPGASVQEVSKTITARLLTFLYTCTLPLAILIVDN